ncbi:uncharacterized protein LOC119025577 isoform X3 [Acanthopagrus latus]|uniref:uncharacterized protein LOC119025577 isoform X3 n=1 Tax=Acanthopagrus latus TaxID=8177 RepID=UPI00187BD4ED|nr:uncharacterized protein LOC119025577 isoform X3 [Acanthopagrus latus]
MFVRQTQSFCTGTHLLLVKLVCFFNFSFHVIGLLGFINSLSLTNVFSFLAHITGLISEQLLRAAVGGSVLIPCSLPGYPLSLNWFYWQEGDNPVFRWENGKEMKIEDNKYEGRFQVFTHEFSAGNISIRLENISLEDDQKTFFSYVKFYDEEKKVLKQSEERCRSKLQVSGLISEQLLSAAVGGSVLIPCSLPGNPLSFYWQEDQSSDQLCHWDNGKTLPACDKYKGRFQVFNSEFSSGNISIRLDNISPEDDQKTFVAFVKFDKQMPPEERCRSRLQVSAPYQDLVLMVKDTTNSATCSARGGYPAAQVSWKGLNRSSDEELDLQDAETFLQLDPTEKTFSFTSSVNVRGLKSVTCIIYNPHSNKTITRTEKIDTGENDKFNVAATVVVLIIPVILIILAGVYWYRGQRAVQDPRNPEPDVPNPQDPVQEEAPAPDQAPAQDPDQPNQPPVDSNAKEPAQEEAAPDQDQDQARAQDPDQPNQSPVDPNNQDGAQAEGEAADAPEDTVLISEDRAAFHRRTRMSEGTADRDTCEDAAASPEKEKLLKKENGTEDRASD